MSALARIEGRPAPAKAPAQPAMSSFGPAPSPSLSPSSDAGVETGQTASGRFIDGLEKAILTLLFVALLWQVGPQAAHQPLKVIFLVPNALVCALALSRRPARRISTAPADWLIALAASTAPLLLSVATGPAESTLWIGQGVMLAGMVIGLAATATLWRSFGVVPANRGIKRCGPYRLIRHPIYAGYALWQLGFVLSNPSWTNLSAFALAVTFQLWRIDREELLLRRDPVYADYAAKVRYRLVPNLF